MDRRGILRLNCLYLKLVKVVVSQHCWGTVFTRFDCKCASFVITFPLYSIVDQLSVLVQFPTNMRILSLLLLLGAFAHHLAIDLEETCPQGQSAAAKCQIKIRDAFTAASKPATTIAEGLLLFCCNLGHGVDCIIHNAIPLCEKSERKELTKAANDYFLTTPLRLMRRSCDGHYFWNRKVPAVCKDVVDAPNLNETATTPYDDDDDRPSSTPTKPVILIVVVVIAVLVLTTFVLAVLFAKKRQRANEMNMRIGTVQYNRNGKSSER